MPSKFRPPRCLKHALSYESTQYKTIQTKYVFKTSFGGHSGLFETTLISHCSTSLLQKPTFILSKSLTSDPHNRGILFCRKSVVSFWKETHYAKFFKTSKLFIALFLNASFIWIICAITFSDLVRQLELANGDGCLGGILPTCYHASSNYYTMENDGVLPNGCDKFCANCWMCFVPCRPRSGH